MGFKSKRVNFVLLMTLAALVAGFAGTTYAVAEERPFAGTVVKALIFRSLDSDYIATVMAPRLEKETGIILKVDQVPYEHIHSKQIMDFMGARVYDIINPCTEWSHEYRRYSLDLGKYVDAPGFPDVEIEDVIPGVWKEWNPSGLPIAWIPYQPDSRVFFFRKDLLKDAGLPIPPKTWDELLTAAEKLTVDKDGDGKIDQYGFGMPARRGMHIMHMWIPFLFSAGGELFDTNWKPTLNSQAGIDALQLFCDIKPFCPPDVAVFGEYETNHSAKMGLLAMGVCHTAITPEIFAPDSPVKDLMGCAFYPVKSLDVPRSYAGIMGGWALGATKYSKNPEAAVYTTFWLTNRENATDMQIHGRQHAARLSMAKNPELLAVNPGVPTIVATLEQAVMLFPGPECQDLSEILGTRLSQAFAGEMTPKEALDITAMEWEFLLESAGYYD